MNVCVCVSMFVGLFFFYLFVLSYPGYPVYVFGWLVFIAVVYFWERKRESMDFRWREKYSEEFGEETVIKNKFKKKAKALVCGQLLLGLGSKSTSKSLRN